MMKSYVTFASLIAISIPFTLYAKEEAHVKLISAKGVSAHGEISFKQINKSSVEIIGKVQGLAPGEHGMHIHEIGDCSDSDHGFEKSGKHFNPKHSPHGSREQGHMGDLGNITADKNGTADFKIQTSKFSLSHEANGILGRAILIHEKLDDEKTDPSGNSGSRILCGVISK